MNTILSHRNTDRTIYVLLSVKRVYTSRGHIFFTPRIFFLLIPLIEDFVLMEQSDLIKTNGIGFPNQLRDALKSAIPHF